MNVNLDELMRLHSAATQGPWVNSSRGVLAADGHLATSLRADCEFIAAAYNAMPELIAMVRELEAQRDWMAQAAANAGWHGVRVGKKYMIDQARIAVSRAQAEQHECPTPEVSCHARDGKLCMSDNHLACAQAADKDSFIMRRFKEVK